MLLVGASQSEYMTRISGFDRSECLVVAVDVGKRSAMALAADHHHRVVIDPFEFDMSNSGLAQLTAAVDRYSSHHVVRSVRFGVEAAGHFHRGLVTELDDAGRDVVEVNPAIVKDARSQIGQRRIKTDVQDCLGLAEALIALLGHTPVQRSGAMATQAAWSSHRFRKGVARKSLINQIHAQADLAFPGLTSCYSHGLDKPSLRVILEHICDPERIVRLGPKRLRTFVVNRGVRMWKPKAHEVVEAARQALNAPAAQRQAATVFVARDMRLLKAIEDEIAECDRQLAAVLGDTPAGVLTSIPGVACTSASYYGAALGDPHRFTGAAAAYRYSGLTPTSYESSGRTASRASISKDGSVALRHAIVTLGRGLRKHQPDFADYHQRLRSTGKPPLVALVAVAHRAHRLAFSMMINQTVFDEHRWNESVEKGRAVKAANAT